MEKQSMPNNISLTQAIKDKIQKEIDHLVKVLDPDYPSVIITPPPDGIDSPSLALVEKVKPDFVRKDDEGWG